MTAAGDDRRRSRIPDHEARGVDDGAPDMSERLWIWFADNGNIRKWSREAFPEGTLYVSPSPSKVDEGALVEKVSALVERLVACRRGHGYVIAGTAEIDGLCESLLQSLSTLRAEQEPDKGGV